MNQYDSLKLLGLYGPVTQDDIKQAYKRACSKYHADRNPAGLEIMKMINVAYNVLKKYDNIEICSAWDGGYSYYMRQYYTLYKK